MRDLLAAVEAWQAEGLAIARAVVVRTFGSAPRPTGASLLLAGDGRMAGSVSGGCVEGATVGHLEEARASGLSRVVRYGISDEEAWGVGLACGGTIDVLVEPVLPAVVLEAARAVERDGTGARAVVTPLPAGSPGTDIGPSALGAPAPPAEPLVVWQDGRLDGSLGSEADDVVLVDAALAALSRGVSGPLDLPGRQLFIEVYPLPPRLVIVGAVPVAMSLMRIARELGYVTIVVDGRPAFATRERFPDVDELIVGWLDEVADHIGLGPSDAVAVLSHDPKLDEPAIVESLSRGCRYVGAIGSRKTQRNRRQRLLDGGLPADRLDHLRGPIGLDLGGQEPAEIALAIMAEVVAARYGSSGLPMGVVRAAELPGEETPALDSPSTLGRSTTGRPR